MYATGMVSTLKYMASTATCAIATTGRKSREKSIGISTGSIISSATSIGDNNNKETSVCLFTVSFVALTSLFTADSRGK